MADIRFKGELTRTEGFLPAAGAHAPFLKLTDANLKEVTFRNFQGKKKVLNIVPSLDTDICAASARRFSEALTGLDDVVLLNISADLPFAQTRFCKHEGLTNVITLSTFRHPDFGTDYGVRIIEGPLMGLMCRAVVVVDTSDHVAYAQQVEEITDEPDYEKAVEAVKKAF